MSYFLGVDIGSVSAKLALVDAADSVHHLDTQKITRSPRSAIIALLNRLGEKFDINHKISIIKIKQRSHEGEGGAKCPVTGQLH